MNFQVERRLIQDRSGGAVPSAVGIGYAPHFSHSSWTSGLSEACYFDDGWNTHDTHAIGFLVHPAQ